MPLNPNKIPYEDSMLGSSRPSYDDYIWYKRTYDLAREKHPEAFDDNGKIKPEYKDWFKEQVYRQKNGTKTSPADVAQEGRKIPAWKSALATAGLGLAVSGAGYAVGSGLEKLKKFATNKIEAQRKAKAEARAAAEAEEAREWNRRQNDRREYLTNDYTIPDLIQHGPGINREYYESLPEDKQNYVDYLHRAYEGKNLDKDSVDYYLGKFAPTLESDEKNDRNPAGWRIYNRDGMETILVKPGFGDNPNYSPIMLHESAHSLQAPKMAKDNFGNIDPAPLELEADSTVNLFYPEHESGYERSASKTRGFYK